MNHKEHILFDIIWQLYRTLQFSKPFRTLREEDFEDDGNNKLFVHFNGANWDSYPSKGDIVLCQTISSNFEMKLGIVEMPISSSECIIKEFGSHKLCHVHNERFMILKGALPEWYWWTNKQAELNRKVIKAYRKIRWEIYDHVYSGIEFEGKEVVIEMRQKFTDKTKTFRMKWNTKTTIKSIVPLILNVVKDWENET